MRLDTPHLVTRPHTHSWSEVQALDAFTAEQFSADVFNDSQTFEVFAIFLRAHGTPTGSTTVLHYGALTQAYNGSRVP